MSKEKGTINIYLHKFCILFVGALLLGASIFVCHKKGFNAGVDFAGGFVVEVACNDCNGADIAGKISKKLGTSVFHQQIDGGYLFKSANTGANYDETLGIYKEVLNANKDIKIVKTDFASPQMTASFLKDSIFACLFAFACIGIYMMIRFNWKFAVGGVLALVYDVLLVLGCISAMQIEVCLITLTALLTIIGYCINDKIVVFDRIRSNLWDRKQPVASIVLTSVKSVLARSVLTSFTTIITTTSLLFFGDRSIFELGLTIICGIFFGTLSSLLIAPSLVLLLRIAHHKPKVEKDLMFYAS